MKRLVEFPLEGGGSVLVEVDETEIEEGLVRAGRLDEVAGRAGQTFEAALETIKPAAAAIITNLRELAEPPDQIGLELGIKLSGMAGAFLASTTAEANFKVALTWKRKEGGS